MGARKRHSVAAVKSSESQMTFSRFMELFPDNNACLAYLKEKFHPDGSRCPKCSRETKFHRIKGRAAYSCQFCGHQVYPTAGTIFHKSTTSLQLWFWAIFLMSSTRCGISAKQLEREIGVSYPTAHRMFKQIRSLLSDENEGPLSGDVEVDESLFGGKIRASKQREWATLSQAHRQQAAQKWAAQKPTVFAMVERGGRVRAMVVPNRTGDVLKGAIRKHVLPESMIFSDEYKLYMGLDREYRGHKRIKHTAQIYVDGETHTQSVEGFFGLVKTGIRGVYHAVSVRYLQNYLDEYSFRFNRRNGGPPIFWAILDRVQKNRLASQ